MAEYVAGTDPSDPTSYFAVTNAIRTSGVDTNLSLQFGSVTGRVYHVLYHDILAGQGWQPLGTVTQQIGTGAPISFDVPVTIGGKRYYRLGVELAE
jgi:hypothetical protein